MPRKLYLAYGSNLSFGQMKYRCPQAEALGSMYIPNWRLVFRGCADIEEGNPEDMLPVGLWSITEECEDTLDIYEGVPSFYDKISLNGIMTYRMTPRHRNRQSPPHPQYFAGVRDGYNDFELDSEHLDEALGWAMFGSEKGRA